MSKIKAPKMVYIMGEEMTRYGMDIILKSWVEPFFDISDWEFYDLSCKSRDVTEDKVLQDAIDAGARVKAIFKEPTITPTADQQKEMGLKKAWGSPNGAMRKGWNGFTISRDTIMIDGLKLGYEHQVQFDRHAVGGEYGAGSKEVGAGKLVTTFYPDAGGEPVVIDERKLKDKRNAAVTYHNPLDNVYDLAHHFFTRSLAQGNVPYIVTKKTVFKWQEGFWQIMKEVFDKEYKTKFNERGLLKDTNGELRHIISDDATMKLIAWTKGGFSMVAHNYDGDMLTDEMSKVHCSPGFVSSSLIGKAADGTIIKEFEASHGTVSDMWKRHQRGEETSLNPMGLVFALVEAMNHAEVIAGGKGEVKNFTSKLYAEICKAFVEGKGTRDMCGASGLSTEKFVEYVNGKIS
jgi:isocitrate dehydrogenase